MAMAASSSSSSSTSSNFTTFHKPSQMMRTRIVCRKKEKGGRDQNYPYKVIEITPPPRHLGTRCFPINLQCGDGVTIEGHNYTISSVTHRYQLRKGKYEPSEKRLDVLSTGRYIVNLYLESLLEQS
uniref:uncharacterized protein LOC122589037 n=1 Tax=Erigeron canadensis TaxID=72917 RepID=UPI001CB8B577|nr:uncharacterized protein LOC122589037 [Erigeron canadensis]